MGILCSKIISRESLCNTEEGPSACGPDRCLSPKTRICGPAGERNLGSFVRFSDWVRILTPSAWETRAVGFEGKVYFVRFSCSALLLCVCPRRLLISRTGSALLFSVLRTSSRREGLWKWHRMSGKAEDSVTGGEEAEADEFIYVFTGSSSLLHCGKVLGNRASRSSQIPSLTTLFLISVFQEHVTRYQGPVPGNQNRPLLPFSVKPTY